MFFKKIVRRLRSSCCSAIATDDGLTSAYGLQGFFLLMRWSHEKISCKRHLTGTLPVNRVSPRVNCSSVVNNRPISVGQKPLMEFRCGSRTLSWDNLSISKQIKLSEKWQLSDRDKRFSRQPGFVGSVLANQFVARLRMVNFDALVISIGNVPFKVLDWNNKMDSRSNIPVFNRSSEWKKLPKRSSCIKAASAPILDGMRPMSWLSVNLRTSKLVSWKKVDGIDQLSMFMVKSTYSSAVNYCSLLENRSNNVVMYQIDLAVFGICFRTEAMPGARVAFSMPPVHVLPHVATQTKVKEQKKVSLLQQMVVSRCFSKELP